MSDSIDAPDDGSLRWSIKRSFLDYVTKSGGDVSLAEPADWVDDEFVFAGSPADDPPSTGPIAFRGEVQFWAHGGLLDVGIADPWLEPGPDGWGVSVDSLDRNRRVRIGELGIVDHASDGRARASVTLTAVGALLFGGVYQAGIELDPLSFPASALPSD